MNMKKLLAVLGVLILSLVCVAGTVAYLTSQDQAVNTFTVGKVDISLDEADVDETGTPIVDDQGNPVERVTENEYHLLPGGTYVKDPTVTVKAGSEESYVRMVVTITDAADIKDVFGSDFLPENYVEGWDRETWVSYSTTEDTEANTLTYEFRYFETVDASEATEDVVLDALFDSFTVPGMLSGEELALIADMQIIVNGHAIQAAGFADADAAWIGFADQMNWDAQKTESAAPSESQEPSEP